MQLNLKDIFTPIPHNYIIKLIDSLYYPYKIYGDLKVLLKDSPKYLYPTEHFDGQLKKWVQDGEKSYVIFNPKEHEIDKIKEFRLIESILEKVCLLKKKQYQWNEKNITSDVANELEEKIKQDIKEIDSELSLIDQMHSLRHYIKTKRFSTGFNEVYKSYEYDKLKNLLQKEFKRYLYILNSGKIDELQFHYKYVGKLQFLGKMQTQREIKAILLKQLAKIKTEYKKNSESKPQQKEGSNSITQKKYLKDLFETTDLYNKAIKILIKNNFVSDNNNSLKWIYLKTPKLKSIRKMLVALIFVLEKNNYLKTDFSTPYIKLKNEFNISMNKSTYKRYKDAISECYYEEDERVKKRLVDNKYISLFDNIL